MNEVDCVVLALLFTVNLIYQSFTYLTLLPNISVSRCRAVDPSFESNRMSKIQKPAKY